MNNPLVVAFIRAAYIALGSGAAVALTTWATTDDAKTIIIATGTAVLSILFGRGAGEGVFDQRTKPDMNVRPATSFDNLPDAPKA